MVDTLFVIFLIAIAGVLIGSIILWLKNNKMDRRLSRRSFILPVVIIMTMLLVLAQKVIWDMESLRLSTTRSIDKVLDDRWEQIEKFTVQATQENFELSRTLKDEVVQKLSKYSSAQLDVALDSVATNPGNIIQQAVGTSIRGKYFRDIESDSNDPFAMLIGKSEDDSFLFADFSENCAVDELTRNLHQEYDLQGKAGDRQLAIFAFDQLLNLKSSPLLSDVIFFQFEAGGGGAPLQDYSWKGIRQAYYKNNGDVSKTFKALEFLAPSYIYKDRSIAGENRIIDRVRTDAKTIAIVSVFSLLEAINNDPIMSYTLQQSEDLQQYLQKESVREERVMLLMGILIMILAVVLFSFFWTYLH